ncbi:cholesterol transport system auxiliary component [Constrictibacter sp. MBR-5]|jgi:cholesterol transport system auxiliary component|uniref:ABC-type transport auxiliary lipoprotein family protein n=1 Tax=Constrictibacter sp. MBR-5 TaxID=3156467 RepID=UPI003397B511
MRPNSKRTLAAFAAVAIVLLSAACARLVPGQGPAPLLYTLTPKSTFTPDLPVVDWQLTLEVPFAAAALNTTRIAVKPGPTSFDYYARASWTDVAPMMMQTLMVESFENSRRIVSVGRASIGLRSDFILKTELREFQAEAFSGQAVVGIDAKLVKMPERTIVAASEFRDAAPADIDDMSSTIAAFDEALGRVLKRMVVWTLTSGQEAWVKSKADQAAAEKERRRSDAL